VSTPQERASAIIAATKDIAPAGHPDLYSTLVHAEAARRRSTDAQAAVASARVAPSRDTLVKAVGDAGEAIVELYLAAAAAKRYHEATGQPLPVDATVIESALNISRHGRDAVMHWDEKMARDPRTLLAPGDTEVFILAPPGKSGTSSIVAGIEWQMLDDVATKLSKWAGSRVPGSVVHL
jgi:hypothetical protein